MPTPASLHSSISSHNSFGSTTTSPTIVNSDTAGESVYEAPSLSVPVASHHELHHHSIKDADRTWGLLDAVANILPVWRYKDQSEEHNPLIPIPSPPEAESPLSLTDKYGKVKDVIILRRDIDNTELYAIKVFHRSSRPRIQNRASSEYCIASCLQHPNIIHTFDLIQDQRGFLCQVMEFCDGGDLYHLVTSRRKLATYEADCFFKQLMRGINYMHKEGVAHRNIKPENLILTHQGSLKIIDFGNAECFRAPWEQHPHFTRRLSGTIPYIAPEEFIHEEFDPRAVDVWAAGITYIAMRIGRLPWRTAMKDEDELYAEYLEGRRQATGYEPIQSLHRECCRNVIYAMLDPNWERRITASQVLRSEWVTAVEVCDAGDHGL